MENTDNTISVSNNEINRKIARRQKLVDDLARITRRMDVLSDHLFDPARFNAHEYENMVNEYRNLELEFEIKERNLRQEFPYKDINEEIERITKIIK